MSDVPAKPKVVHSFTDISIPSPPAQTKQVGWTAKPLPAPHESGASSGVGVSRGASPPLDSYSPAESELNARRHELERLTRTLAEKERENKHLKDENERLRPILTQLQSSCDAAQARLSALKGEADQLAASLPDGRLAAIKHKEDQIAQQEQQIQRDLADATELGASAEAEAQALLESARTNAEQQISAARSECDAKLQVLIDREVELKRRATEIETPLKEAEKNSRALQHALRSAQERITTLESQSTALVAKCVRAAERIAERTREIAEREAERDAAKRGLENANGLVRRLQRDVELAQDEITAMRSREDQVRKQLQQQASERDPAKRALENANREVRRLKRELDAAQNAIAAMRSREDQQRKQLQKQAAELARLNKQHDNKSADDDEGDLDEPELKHLPFELLPPGTWDIDDVISHYKREALNLPGDLHGLTIDWERIRAIKRLKPCECYIGREMWLGYAVYTFKYSTRVILECPIERNATYVVSGNWKAKVRHTKKYLRSRHPDSYTKVVHKGDWLERVKDALIE